MNAPAPESGGAAIAVRGLRHAYNGHTVLDGVDLDVPAGTVLALLGPSGCGKSTLLKALAGLLRPQSGSIRIGGQTAFDGRRHDPPEARGLGMVFQDYALWPHMSVAQNVGFPLEMRGVPRRERPAGGRGAGAGRAGSAGRAPPSELSGGQQQRVALARAIVGRPRLLLFDEPLSNLDRDLRETLCAEIGALLRRLGATAVYVTHDHQEAHALAHVIACMQHGQIVPTRSAARFLQGRHCGPAEPDPRSVAPVASAANRAPLLRTIRMNLLNSPNFASLFMTFTLGLAAGPAKALTVYTAGPGGLIKQLAAGFQEKTGIKVDVFQATTGKVMARLEAEAANPAPTC